MMILGFIVADSIIPITLILTCWNIYNCLAKTHKKEKLISVISILLGAAYYRLLFIIDLKGKGEWYEQIYDIQYHNSISSKYWLIYLVVILGFIGYLILLNVSASTLPPLLSAISIGFLILINIIQLVFAVQISKNISDESVLLYVYHANILLLSARVIHRHMKEKDEIFRNRLTENEDHKKVGHISDKIDSLSKYSIFIFVVFLLLVALIELIFVLLGQGLDAPIKAFTETADWTFSKQIPPPSVKFGTI